MDVGISRSGPSGNGGRNSGDARDAAGGAGGASGGGGGIEHFRPENQNIVAYQVWGGERLLNDYDNQINVMTVL